MLIIDCHAHIYSPDEKRYPPKDQPLRPPKGKGSVEDLRKESLASGVRAVRAIQTLTFYGVDNRYLIDSAKANKGWLAGVCNVDPDDPHSPLLLREFVREPEAGAAVWPRAPASSSAQAAPAHGGCRRRRCRVRPAAFRAPTCGRNRHRSRRRTGFRCP
jgi:hypothetical protein